METLRDLFVGAVGVELMRWRATRERSLSGTKEDELHLFMSQNMGRLVHRKQCGHVFIWQQYLDQVQQNFDNASGREQTEIFWKHCLFQGMIQVLPSFPRLVAQFHLAGLSEWTELVVDRETFHEFAEARAEMFLENTAVETVLEAAAAEEGELLVMISDVFNIPIPQDSERLAHWCMTHMSTSHSQAVTLLR